MNCRKTNESIDNLKRVSKKTTQQNIIMSDAEEFSDKASKQDGIQSADKLKKQKPFTGASKQPTPKDPEQAKISLDESLFEAYDLVGQDGNAFYLMGYTARAMKECGLYDEVQEMRDRATSGDYDNLIRVCDEYIQRCNEICGDDDDWDDDDDDDYYEDWNKGLQEKYCTGYSLVDNFNLDGSDDPFDILAYTEKAMNDCDLYDDISYMRSKATSRDYNTLLRVCSDYIDKCNSVCDLNEGIGDSIKRFASDAADVVRTAGGKKYNVQVRDDDGYAYDKTFKKKTQANDFIKKQQQNMADGTSEYSDVDNKAYLLNNQQMAKRQQQQQDEYNNLERQRGKNYKKRELSHDLGYSRNMYNYYGDNAKNARDYGK